MSTGETQDVPVRVQLLAESSFKVTSRILGKPVDVNTCFAICLALNAARNALPDSDKNEVRHDIIKEFNMLFDQLWDDPLNIEARNSDERGT